MMEAWGQTIATGVMMGITILIVKRWFNSIATKEDIEAIVSERLKPVDNRINRHVDRFVNYFKNHEGRIATVEERLDIKNPGMKIEEGGQVSSE